MTEKKSQIIRAVYGICLAVWTVVVATLFIVQIWALFRATDVEPYSVETVSARFAKIAVPFWIWIAMVIGGGLISWGFPEEEIRPKAFVSTYKTLTRLKARLPENAEGMVEVKKESMLRNIIWGVCAALCVAASIVALVYLLDKDYVATFATDFYKSHAEAEKLVKIFPFVFASLCVCAGALIYQSYSLKKELSLVKQVLAESAKRGEKPAVKEKKDGVWQKVLAFCGKEKTKNIVRIVLAAGAVVLVIVGISNGGMRDVLEKAINICTQCIGLG